MRLRGGLRNARAGLIVSQFVSLQRDAKSRGQMCVNISRNGEQEMQVVAWALTKAKHEYDKDEAREVDKPTIKKTVRRHLQPGQEGFNAWKHGGRGVYENEAECRADGNPDE